jgi:hypothetical protein
MVGKFKTCSRAVRAWRRGTVAAFAPVENEAEALVSLNVAELRDIFSKLPGYRSVYAAALAAYDTAAQTVLVALNRVLDSQSNTAGWQDFLDIAADPERLRTLLIERKARATVAKELETALNRSI